jgi:hypothetical protein
MELSRRQVLVGGGRALALTAAAYASWHVVADQPKLKLVEIDRRNASSNIEYRLIFTARSSGTTIEFPGHAYMMTGEYDNVQKVCRFDKTKVMGFYPAKEASTLKTFFGFPVPGEVGTNLKKDLDQELITHRLDLITAQNGYDAAVAAAKNFVRQNPYQLGATDCVALAAAMLVGVEKATRGADGKLMIPDKEKFQTPKDYLTQVLTLNGLKVP